MRKPKVIVVVGQTATGKSNLAVKLAKKFKGEIISADSRQVYKELDIGTGKITNKEMQGIKHYLLDVADPRKDKFSVNDFKNLAEKRLKEIIKNKKIPIICGGTGFYIDSITSGVVLPEVPPNIILRKKLEKLTPLKLFSILNKLDKTRAKNIDKNNKVRLIRAIEIAKRLGKIPKVKTKGVKYKFIKIGLKLEKEKLKEKIEKRLLIRIKQGMLNEAKKLHKNGLSWKRMEELGLEYRYLAIHLQKKVSKEEMIERLNTGINNYAKRQNTWFKRDKNIKWFSPLEYKKIEDYLKKKI